MNDPSTAAAAPRRKWVAWIGRVARPVIIVLFITSLLGISETSAHVVLGWIGHLQTTLPALLPKWPELLVPLGCLALATWLVHRFIRWWLGAKGSPVAWHARHTLSATAIVLSGAAAAIALSGVVHQVVWLSDAPLYERRGADFARADATNSARQTLYALEEFYLEKGHYPDSLDELSLPARLTMVPPLRGTAPEPFVYFKPHAESDPDTVVLVSPVLRQHKVVIVGLLSGATEVHPAAGLPGILETRRRPSKDKP